MNEQLQSALSEMINKAMNGVDSSVDFLSAEIPDVIHQLLLWYGVSSAIYAILGIVCVLVMLKIDVAIYGKIKDSWIRDDIAMIYGAFGSFLRLVYIIPICFINIEWLQIWIAPKIWLIEYAANLVK